MKAAARSSQIAGEEPSAIADRRRAAWHDAAAILLLLAAPILLYRKVTRLWWMLDDPFHLNVIAGRSIFELFFDAGLWSNIPARVFTPLLLVSMKADAMAFGGDALPFYVHQLVAFALIAPLMYVLLRQWLGVVPSLVGALLVIVGRPAIDLVTQIMLRHYVEGLVLAIVATILYVRRWNALSATAYLLAMSAKEVFVPLIVVLGLIERRRRLWLHAVALAIYAAWRIAMMGVALRGYGWAARPDDWPRLLATLPGRAVGVFAKDADWAGWLLVAAIAIAALFAARKHWLFVILAIGIALAPIAPVSIEMHARYALVLWIFAAVAVARLNPRLSLPILLLALIVNRLAWAPAFRAAMRMSDEARVFALLGGTDLLLMPATPPATIAQLAQLTKSPARWSYDPLPLCAKRVTPRRVFAFDAARREVREMPPECTPLRDAPLAVRFEVEENRLFWRFGPHEEGRYRIVAFDGIQGWDMPREAGVHLDGVDTLTLRVRYDAPAGWATYSPDLRIDMKKRGVVGWGRN